MRNYSFYYKMKKIVTLYKSVMTSSKLRRNLHFVHIKNVVKQTDSETIIQFIF